MSNSPPTASSLRYSIVVPVFNEADNIAAFCAKTLSELPPDNELLICYDFDGDTTLPALAAMPAEKKPAMLRLIRNDLGRGVRYAIEAGMRAAAAPVVVVMMADLSDDFPKVGEMVRRCEGGADVVCPSRYMRGGKQIGGPWLKGMMSRCAGLSLHYLAGLPTRDPTNSFKAYRKSFLETHPIESTAGFCLGLELTVKCHWTGGRVEEVPATWYDRTAGESRFKLMKWLPMYLHWYFWAFAQQWLRPGGRVNPRSADDKSSPARWPWAMLLVFIGLSLATLPHLISAARFGDPTWIADHDDLGCYLAVGSQAYFNHPWRVGDGVHADNTSGMYDWILIAPAVLGAKAFHAGPQSIGAFMRIFGGITIPIALFALLREHFRKTSLGLSGAAVAAVGILFLTDGGQLSGSVIYRQLIRAGEIAMGHDSILHEAFPLIQSQWRIITPCMILAVILLTLLTLTRVHDLPSGGRIVAAGIAMGATLYVYFYLWTTLWAALFLLWLFDARRRLSWFFVGAIGSIIGCPAVVMRMRDAANIAPGWRQRTENLLHIGHFHELLIPWFAVALLLLTAWYLFRFASARRLVPLWLVALCGLALENNQLVTGLQIQNFHWDLLWGPCLILLTYVMIVHALFSCPNRRRSTFILWALAIVVGVCGFYLRIKEATASATALQHTEGYRRFEKEERAAPAFLPNAIIAGSPDFVNYAIVLDNVRPLVSYSALVAPRISNAEWNQRMALNDYLLGFDRIDFAARSDADLATAWGPTRRDPLMRAKGVTERLACYDSIVAAPLNACRAANVAYVALPVGQAPPLAILKYAVRLRDDPSWSIWEIHY